MTDKITSAFNRTTLELKLRRGGGVGGENLTFNRTTLELKL